MAYNCSRTTNYAIRNVSETNGGFMVSTHTIKKIYYTIPVQEIIALILLIRFSKPDQADNFKVCQFSVELGVQKQSLIAAVGKCMKGGMYLGGCTTVNGWTNKESKYPTLPSS